MHVLERLMLRDKGIGTYCSGDSRAMGYVSRDGIHNEVGDGNHVSPGDESLHREETKEIISDNNAKNLRRNAKIFKSYKSSGCQTVEEWADVMPTLRYVPK